MSQRNWAPEKVCPKDQPAGATLQDTTVRPSLVVTLNERLWPLRQELLCQFWPQLRDIACQPVLDPLMETEWTSPAPPTLVIRTRLKQEWPLTVNLIPPLLLQGTLQRKKKEKPKQTHLVSDEDKYNTSQHFEKRSVTKSKEKKKTEFSRLGKETNQYPSTIQC